MKNNKSMVEALRRSRIYQEYERAFADATGLSVTFRPVEPGPQRDGSADWTPLCAMMTQEGTCGASSGPAPASNGANGHDPASAGCPIGLCDTAVPVRMGDELIGFLQSGNALCRRPSGSPLTPGDSPHGDSETARAPEEFREAFPGSRGLSGLERQAIVKLLTLFAQHLSVIGNQILVQQAGIEPPVIARARDYIARHYSEELSLPQVARAMNTSTFYFCKLFKKHTGINFIDHVSRVRIERAKLLLQNPNLRVSEIAYEVGFQSLTHFNRVFKRIEGRAPTIYRRQLVSCETTDLSAA